jgi:hypothetical protein
VSVTAQSDLLGEFLSPEQKRQAVLQAYPGGNWANKVIKMTDAQIHAVYIRLTSKKKENK